MKLKFDKRTVLIAILSIFVFFGFRSLSLNTLPVFVDEAIYVRWSQVMKNEPTLRFLPQSDGKQPLFMWTVMPALKFVSDPLIAGRVVSIACGFFSFLGVCILAYLLSGKALAGVLSGLIYALTPFTVFFDRMALVDAMLAMFGIWSIIFGFLFIKTLRLDLAIFLGFILGGGLLTKSPAIIFYIWQIIMLFFFLVYKKSCKIDYLKLLGGWMTTFIISQSMYAILKLGPNSHLINSRNFDYVFSFHEILSHPLFPLLQNLRLSLNWYIILIGLPSLALSGISLMGKHKHASIVLICLTLIPIFSQAAIAKVYTSRYILFTTLPIIISSGIGLSEVFPRIKYLCLLLLLPIAYKSYLYAYQPSSANMPYDMRSGYLEEWTAGTGQKEIANYLISKSMSGQKIVVGTEGTFGTLPDGLQIYTQNYPSITVIGTNLPITKIPDSLMNTSSDNLIYFVLNRSRNKMDQSDLDKLTLIASYPKSKRSNGTWETLDFYQLKRNR